MGWFSVPYSVRKHSFCYLNYYFCRYTSLCAKLFKVLYVLTAVVVVLVCVMHCLYRTQMHCALYFCKQNIVHLLFPLCVF